MSATLDASKFAAYFGGARVVHVEGRAFPVAQFYAAAPLPSYVDAAVRAAVQAHADEAPGDVLVFLTGSDEIEAAARLLRDRVAAVVGPPAARTALVVPLYAALAPAAQAAAFDPAPPATRKIILATNVAETSVTLPGVRYVIDAGLVKARTYAPAAGADALAVVPVSQAQAAQRAGRAGREAPGKCFRLYTEASFRALARSAPPDLQRANRSDDPSKVKAKALPRGAHVGVKQLGQIKGQPAIERGGATSHQERRHQGRWQNEAGCGHRRWRSR
jgi:ATP-dependent RNA helicase DHX8/PRP22